MSIFSADTAREAAYKTIREKSLESLAHPGIAARLGEYATELTDELADAFCVQRKNDTTTLPEEQLQKDNIGLHPFLRRDRTLPNTQPYGMRISRYSYGRLQDIDPSATDVISAEPYYPFGKSTGALQHATATLFTRIVHFVEVPNPATDASKQLYLAMPRPLIVTRGLHALPPVQIAAALAHEIDHAITNEEQAIEAQRSRPLAAQLQEFMSDPRYTTTLERSASEISRVVFEAHRIEPEITITEAIKLIKGMQPAAAGAELGRPRGESTTKGERRLPGYIIAAALSEAYGEGDTWATEAEAEAYTAAGLLH